MPNRDQRRAALRQAYALAHPKQKASAVAATAASAAVAPAAVATMSAGAAVAPALEPEPQQPPIEQQQEQPTEHRSISEAKLAANRANAVKSTGPVTAEGKAKSSLNAVKTGLTGRTILLSTEEAAVYEAHISNTFLRRCPLVPFVCFSLARSTCSCGIQPGLCRARRAACSSPASTTMTGRVSCCARSSASNSALKLNGASVCVQQGTTTELNLADSSAPIR